MCSNCMASAQVIVNETKIKGGCQSGRKVVTHDSKSDLPLDLYIYLINKVPLGHLNGTLTNW